MSQNQSPQDQSSLIQTSQLQDSKIKIVQQKRLHSAKQSPGGKNGYRAKKKVSSGEQQSPSQVDMMLDLSVFNPNTKVTVKPLYVHSSGTQKILSPQNNLRVQTQPGKPRPKQVKSLVKKASQDKVYRLPSLSKCLEHEILPKNSRMLKEICEIATTNTGFIKSHFEEYIKTTKGGKKGSGVFSPKQGLSSVNLQVDGKVLSSRGERPRQVGIKNIELFIDPNINIMNQPVILPTAQRLRSPSQLYSEDGRVKTQESISPRVQATTQNVQQNSNQYYYPSNSLPSGATFDTKINKGIAFQGLFSEINGIQQLITSSQPSSMSLHGHLADQTIFMKGQATGGQRSPQTAIGGQRHRMNVFSSGQQQPIVKQYNGKSYYHFPTTSDAGMRSDNMVQTEALSSVVGGVNEDLQHDPRRTSSMIKRDLSASKIPNLAKSGSSTSSLGLINANQLSEIFLAVDQETAKRSNNNMSPIKVKNYPFRGILSADWQQTQPIQDVELKQVQSTQNLAATTSGVGEVQHQPPILKIKSGAQTHRNTSHQITPSSLMVSAYTLKQNPLQKPPKLPSTAVLSPRSNEDTRSSRKTAKPQNIKNLQMGLIFKKSEDGDSTYKRNIRNQQPNTDDLAPVYDEEDVKQYNSTRRMSAKAYQTPKMLRGDQQPSSSVLDQEKMKQEAHSSFQKNNVRTEMAYMTSAAMWGHQQHSSVSGTSPKRDTTTPRTFTPNMIVSSPQPMMGMQGGTFEDYRRENDLSQIQDVSQLQLVQPQMSGGEGVGQSYIPTIQFTQSPRYNNSQLQMIQGRIIPSPGPLSGVQKQRENFTIVMPPMSTQSNQMSLADINTTNQQDTTQINQQPIDTSKLNKDESQDQLPPQPVAQSTEIEKEIIKSPSFTYAPVMRSQATQAGEKVLLFTQHIPSEPIKSVYQHEQEAKAQGIIKELSFVPPPKAQVQKSPKKKLKRYGQASRQTTGVLGTVQEEQLGVSLRISPRQMATNNSVFKRPETQRASPKPTSLLTAAAFDPFTESDQEQVERLMKEVMPSNYMRKRRADLAGITKQLNMSSDFSIRAAQKQVRQGFGIKKLSAVRDETLKSSRYKDLERTAGGGGKEQLISFCFGTAPAQYKLDIPHLNTEIMNLDKPLSSPTIEPPKSPSGVARSTRQSQDAWAVQAQSRGTFMMINGTQVNMNMHPTKHQLHTAITMPRNDSNQFLLPRPSSGYLNLNQDLNSLRTQGQKFMLGATPQTLNGVSEAQQMNLDGVQHLATVESMGGGATPVKENDMRSLGIKTTISITHHPVEEGAKETIDSANTPSKIVKGGGSQRVMQPLGSTLRQRRNAGRGSQASQESLELSPQQMMVTKTTFNYDSRTGLEQQFTQTTPHKGSPSKTFIKISSQSALHQDNSSSAIKSGGGGNTIIPEQIEPPTINTGPAAQTASGRDNNITSLTGRLSQEKSNMGEGVEEKLGARFSSNNLSTS